MRGNRRLHKHPSAYEIERCKVWLELEREMVKPVVIVRVSFFARCALAPIWAAMLVRAIMVIACDAANAQRLPSGPSIPIDIGELSAVTKLLQVRVTENVIVPNDADTGQLANLVIIKFRSLYSNHTGCHIGLWRKHGGSEFSLVEAAEINRANYGLNFCHQSMGPSVARVFNQRSNNPLHVRTVRLVSVVN